MMRKRTRIPFTKLEALGNDFVLIDGRDATFNPSADQVVTMADRRRGIGFDQLLALRPPSGADAICRVDVYNSDGSMAEQCGNGMRAVALWLHRRGEFDRRAVVETAAGPVSLIWESAHEITAVLPPPEFTPAACGLTGHDHFPAELRVGDGTCRVHGASMGNPHLVLEVEQSPDPGELQRTGSALSQHPDLVNGANIGFARMETEHRVNLQVYERGAGPTLACGSGACAAATVLIRAGRLRSPVEVVQQGGTLVIDWEAEGAPVAMTGPASKVFEGVIPWTR
jgi:diaminopimelate epimerase